MERRRRGRGGEGGIRMGRKRGAGGKDIVLGAKPEWSEVEWRTGGGGTEEGSEKESGIRVRGRHGSEILRKDRKKSGRKC